MKDIIKMSIIKQKRIFEIKYVTGNTNYNHSFEKAGTMCKISIKAECSDFSVLQNHILFTVDHKKHQMSTRNDCTFISFLMVTVFCFVLLGAATHLQKVGSGATKCCEIRCCDKETAEATLCNKVV